jgi:hypothetical protein
MKRFSVLVCVGLVLLGSAALGAQTPKDLVAQGAAAAQEARDRDLAKIVPVKVKIVLSKYQGEKKISSLPYEMAVRTDGTTSNIRMGTQVPVPGMGAPVPPAPPTPNADGGGKPAPPAPGRIGPFNYHDVGTNIDCRVTNLDTGRYSVTVSIEDSSVYRDDPSSQATGVPAFRSFRTLNSLILRDGQTTEFTAAADKVSGEVIKAEVTLTVVK